MDDLRTPQRQSPLAMVFLALRIVRSIGLVQIGIVLAVVGRGLLDAGLVVVSVVATVLVLLLGGMSALAWWRYTFHVVGHGAAAELVVNKGVLRADRLSVPARRVQSVAIDQWLLHRLTGLVTVSVDSAGSEGAEFSIDAVSRSVAEELQRRIVVDAVDRDVPEAVLDARHGGELDAGAAPVAAPAEEPVVLRHGAGRLVVAALTMWPLAGLVVLGPIIAFSDQFAELLPVEPPEVDRDGFRWWWVLVGLALFALLSALLNVVRVLLQDWDLTLRAGPSSVRRTSGLLSRTSRASSVARVQVLSGAQNPLQRWRGIRTAQLSTIGDGDISVIGVDDDQFDTVAELAGFTRSSELALDRRIERAEVFLAVRNTTLLVAVAAVVASRVIGWWSLLVLLVVPWVWLTTHLHVRNFRWQLVPSPAGELVTHSRVVDTSSRRALLHKANAVRVTRTIFERRRGLAKVHLSTAAGVVTVGMLPVAEACAVRDVILHAAETDTRDWM